MEKTQTFKYIIIAWLVLMPVCLHAQTVYYHVSNKALYDFLDEMASEGYIELNTAVKPYSRIFIAEKLSEILSHEETLNRRQKFELQFYLKDFNKEIEPDKNFKKRFDVFYFKDSLFTFSLNAIAGAQYWSNENGTNYHRWNGAEVFAYVGKHVGVYASLCDNHEDKQFSGPSFLDTRPAARYKNGNDFSEMRGGISYSWKWGNIGLVKDHMEWGTYYRYPSIISSKIPSVTQIKLNLKPAKWLEFNYFHAWLNSGVIDSTRSYSYVNSYGSSTRIVYRNKYIASNLFTFKPVRGLHTSVGNSIIYSDVNVNPAYLIPFMLYKSIDHTTNSTLSNEGGQNSQFFIDISSRQINHVHVYATLFFDDISISRMKENGHLDYYSLNAGLRVSNLIPNTAFTFEYFQSYPLVYKHIIPTTTYESNFYNLGHYMQDNSRNIYTELMIKPFRTLTIKLFSNYGVHGQDHTELATDRQEVVNYFMDETDWKRNELGFALQYRIINDLYLAADYSYSKVSGNQEKYTTPFYYNNTNTFSIGVNFGF